MEPILEIRNLNSFYHQGGGAFSKKRTVQVLKNVNVTLGQGEVLGLVGESGSGKTVTAMALAGLLSNAKTELSGQIFFRGMDLLQASRETVRALRGREIAVVFQEPMTSMDPVMPIGPQVEEALMVHTKLGPAQRREKALQAMADAELPEPAVLYGKYPHELSGGMLQRAMVAAAIISEPKLLICDEPTTALDVTIQAQVLELMNELKEKLRTSLLLITHDLGVVAQVCDRVAIMYAGEIVESGTIAEVFDHPHHPYTIGLFGSIPSLDETAEKLKPIQGQMPDPTELPEGCAFAPRCPYATGACRTRKPEMTGVGGTQMVRCLAHQGVFESPELMEEVRHGR